MIGLVDNEAPPRPSTMTATEVVVILPGRPSDTQLEFGIPVIRDDTFDRLCLEFPPRGSRSPGTETSNPKPSNSDTTPAVSESTTSGVRAATAENRCMAGDLIGVSAASAGCPGLSGCDAGLFEAPSKLVQTPKGVSQEQHDKSMQDDWSSATDPLDGGSSQTHLATHLDGTGIPVNAMGSNGICREDAERIIPSEAKKNKPAVEPGPKPSSHTNLNAGKRSSVWYKNSWKDHVSKR